MLAIYSMKATFAATITALTSSAVVAEEAAQFGDIISLDARSAEKALNARGFLVDSAHRNVDGDIYSYWWERSADQCVRV